MKTPRRSGLRQKGKLGPNVGEAVERTRHLGLPVWTETPAVGDAESNRHWPHTRPGSSPFPSFVSQDPHARAFRHLRGAQTTGSGRPPASHVG